MSRIRILVFTIFLFIGGCQTSSEKDKSIGNTSGEELAKIHCASCHKFPEPSLLKKTDWENQILPRMANMMGIYKTPNERDNLIQNETFKNIFPPQPLIEKTDWEKIYNFYISKAPQQLFIPEQNIQVGLDNFKVIPPSFQVSPPSSTLVRFMKNQTIFVGDALSKKLFQFDQNLNFLKAGNIVEGAVHLEVIENEFWILSMGSFSPTDQPSGMLINLPQSENKRAQIIADQLKRPVHASYGDLNQDGLTDIVISEFGKWTGQLNILYNKGNKEFVSNTLMNQTGATKTFIRDFNNDGLPDIMALFAQGKEAIYIFYNKGRGEFLREEVLSFSPSHGSTNMELIDLENDGDWDILYTAGDNADFKPILKPYHGVYVFENTGDNNFSQKYFYQLNGAYGAKMADFDLDGDLDIAAISFFPDYAHEAKESFIYLENKNDFSFTASTFENNTRGRWIVMDAKDKDGDGDIDLILGSLTFEVIPDLGYMDKWIKNGLPFVILENQTK